MAAIPSTTTSSEMASNVVAILPADQTTLTATAVPGTTGLAVLDGTTLTWRQTGITLSNGAAVSLGFNGLVDATTTALYSTVTEPASGPGSPSLSTREPSGASQTTSESVVSTLMPVTSMSSGASVVTTISDSSGGSAASGTQSASASSSSSAASASVKLSLGLLGTAVFFVCGLLQQ